jgi:hypothetical protein
VKAPPNGGFDLLIVTVVPPALVIVKVRLTWLPTVTWPKSSVSLENSRLPGWAAEASIPTVCSPPLLFTSIVSWNLPAVVGSKSISTVMLSPGAIVSPACGAPVAEKGAPGSWTD